MPSSSRLGALSKKALAVASPALLALSLAGCAGAGTGGGGDIAQVGDQHIARSDFEAKLEAVPAAKGVLLQLVQSALIDQYADKNHVDVTDAEIDKKLTDLKSKYPPGQFEKIVAQQNLTNDDIRKILKEQIIVEKSVPVKVTDADMQAFLAKNHAQFDTPEQVDAKHILVADLATATTVENKLKAGGDFAALAKQYSTDPSSKDKGGELGKFGKGQMVPTFSEAAFKQKINEVGPPVKSPFGYHIIVVESHAPATPATLANSRDKIKEQLTAQQNQQQIPLFLASLRSGANIQIFDDKLKDAVPPAPPAPAASTGAAAAPSAAGPSAAAAAPSAAASK